VPNPVSPHAIEVGATVRLIPAQRTGAMSAAKASMDFATRTPAPGPSRTESVLSCAGWRPTGSIATSTRAAREVAWLREALKGVIANVTLVPSQNATSTQPTGVHSAAGTSVRRGTVDF
jgi:hypothetical protein